MRPRVQTLQAEAPLEKAHKESATGDLVPVTNTVGQKFDPPPPTTKSIIVVSFTRAELNFDHSIMLE